MPKPSSFDAIAHLEVDGRRFLYHSLPRAAAAGLGPVDRLPACLKLLLENLLRHEDGEVVGRADIEAVAGRAMGSGEERDIAFHPARVMMPDSSGVPLLADLAAMRDAIVALGGEPGAVNPRVPVDVVIDHSVIVDVYGSPDARERNLELEYQRNGERYAFLRWGQGSFRQVRIVPPGVGICHQVNLEFLSDVVHETTAGGQAALVPDTLLGMDSHTPMINGLGILGWGVGGIEAAAAMLGQPVSLRLPEVVGVRLQGALREGVTATDLVLSLTERLRAHGVVQKFVEFHGPGLDALPVPDRATCANMAPEYGATIGYFPLDRHTVDYLRLTGRTPAQVATVEAYARAQGLWREPGTTPARYTEVITVDLAAVEPSLAGPRRPQDRVPLAGMPEVVDRALTEMLGEDAPQAVPLSEGSGSLRQGDVVLAAITSCTNTSNTSNMLAAGLLAAKARERGLETRPGIKTSLSPGSRVVADYLARAGLDRPLGELGFHVAGFGCMTCMGNSGPLAPEVTRAVEDHDLVVGAVLSGNRNFEGRVHPLCRVNFLASPPLVVAYAIAGSLRHDLRAQPLGEDPEGRPVFLADIWPSTAEVAAVAGMAVGPDLYRERYADALDGDARWQALPTGTGETFEWQADSTYIRRPPFFAGMTREPPPIEEVRGARALVILGDSITTDHISPVGAIPADSTAGRYLIEQGIPPRDFNSYAGRRVNHDVMLRGTFANIRLRNELVAGREGGWTVHQPSGEIATIHETALRYRAEDVPLVVVAGRDYGAGSSRDWAAKGTRLLGVRAVIAEGFERIHRSNLVGMGVLPLQFQPGEDRRRLGLDGTETYDLAGLAGGLVPGGEIACRIHRRDGTTTDVGLRCRLDTARDADYYRHGGILPYVLRTLLPPSPAAAQPG